MLSPELLKKVDSLFIRSRRKVTDVFSGEYESAFRGSGIEFEEFREYTPGDDIRQIDWNVTARMDRPFVRVYREEREQTLFFLVDSSRSLFFGKQKTKMEVASEIAALLSYAAIKSSDKVGLIIFSDQIEKYIPPKKGKGHVWNVIATLLSHEPQGKQTNIQQALQFFLRTAHRRTTCFLLSDFFDDNYQHSLRVANLKHEMIVLRLLDSFETDFTTGALMDFDDLETGENLSADLNDRKNITHDFLHKKKELEHFAGINRIDFLDLSADEDCVEALLKFFIHREKKR